MFPALPAAPGAWGPRGAYLAAEHLQRIRVTDQPEAPAPRPALLAQVEKDDGSQRRVGQRLCLRIAAARLPVPRPRVAPGPGQVIKADESLGSPRLRILLDRSRSIFVHPPAGGPGGAGATRGEPVGRLEWRGHGGVGGLGDAAGRLQRRGGMAGRATASPPAGAGPPPSSCPAVCGLRSSSSPCSRGPEPRAGRRRRGGPRCRCWPPPGGRPAPSGSACPLCSPTSARGDGMLPGARGRAVAEDAPAAAAPRRALRTAGSLTPTSSPGSSSPRRQWGLTRGPPAPPHWLPRVSVRGHSWTGSAVPGGAGRGAPARHRGRAAPALWGCGGTTGRRSAQHWGQERARKPHAALGGGKLQWDTAAQGEGEPGGGKRERCCGNRPPRPVSPAGEKSARSKADRAKVPRGLQEPVWSPPECCLSLARDPRPAAGPQGLPPALSSPPKSGDRATELGACGSRPGLPPFPAAREWSPRPEPVAPGLIGYTSPASSSQGGSAPRRGRGPVTPQPCVQPVPPVPPARRTLPELPLPVRVPAAAGAGPDDGGPRRQRPGGQAGDTRHGPERGARAAGHFRPLPSQTFLQRHRSKGFSATTRHFDIPRLSQDRASKCLEFFSTLETAFSLFPSSHSIIF